MESEERKLLRALCRALMAMDRPQDLTEGEREALEAFTDKMAVEQGFTNWLDAYHRI